MIKAALERNNSDNIRYKVLAVEDYDYPCETYDIIISSLTLHYVENLTQIFALIYKTLKKNGVFVFTIEHPIFTALGTQEWIYDKIIILYTGLSITIFGREKSCEFLK